MSPESQSTFPEFPLLQTIGEIAAVWFISDIGYYIFLPALGLSKGYAGSFWEITLYYLFWLIVTIFTFLSVFKIPRLLENKLNTYVPMILGSGLVVIYLGYLLPHLPVLGWSKSWQPATELLYATPGYFLPKSIEILFQQLLIVVLVRTFAAHHYSWRTTAMWCAGLFGGAHILLILGGKGFLYTVVFTMAAIIASFVFAHLILRVKNGIIYSYFLHWSFYALVIVLLKLVSST